VKVGRFYDAWCAQRNGEAILLHQAQVDALLAAELSHLNAAGPSDPPFPDVFLARLDFLLCEPALLELALDALDCGRVCFLASPSGRGLWQVASSAVGRRGTRAQLGRGADTAHAERVDLAGSGLCGAGDAGGAGTAAYTVLLEGAGFCTCLDFRRRVAAAGAGAGADADARFCCAHLLAAALARAAHGAPAKQRAVSDEELARLLCAAAGAS
jgi:hypothetical protein